MAGVEVGKVSKVEHPEPGKPLAAITMRIEDGGRPLHRDATVKIRPRLFLEGNWFLDLEPGTPGAPEIPDGGEIPVTQTAGPVQLGQLFATSAATCARTCTRSCASTRAHSRAGRPRLQALDPLVGAGLPQLGDRAGRHARRARARPVRLHRQRREGGPRARRRPRGAQVADRGLRHRGRGVRPRGGQPRGGNRRAAPHAARARGRRCAR